MTAGPSDRAQRRLREIAAHRVIDDVHAAPGERLRTLLQVFFRVVDGEVRSVCATEGQLLFARGCGDYARAEAFAISARGNADAARRTKHEERLARAEGRAIDEGMHGRRV